MDEQQTVASQKNTSSLAIPVAIVVGFGLIAAAIYFSGSGASVAGQGGQGNIAAVGSGQEQAPAPTGSPDAINPVTENDHIRGNPNAQIVLVEYSDYDCPFCKNFHETMNRIMDEYGRDGRVAWVYRHFPLEQLHPNAPRIAQAAECVASLGGNEAFWTFSDLVFGEREINEPTDPLRIPEFAETAGVAESDFTACMESGETQPAVEEDFQNAVAIGGRGTPHSIILIGDQQGVINGAQPYEVVKEIIDNLIAQVES